MKPLAPNERTAAAALFAESFAHDPAFVFVSSPHNADAARRSFFENYLHTCKELLLYKTSDAMEGALCLYRWDTPFPDDYDGAPLAALSQFQILDRYYERDFAVLDIMAVRPECRGRGLAGQMIDFFVDYCRQEGLIPLTEIFDAGHLALYRAHGFVVAHSAQCAGITTYVLEYPL